MFNKCHKCGQELKCQDEYASLKAGYWWSWRNKTRKDRYRIFINNLLSPLPALGEDDVQFPYPLPKPYKCAEKESCKGGVDSTCTDGYKGPLCRVCGEGYYQQVHQCKKCPSKTWITGQLLITSAILIIIIAVCLWTQRQNKIKRKFSTVDSFLSKIKIAIGFYQVTHCLVEAFAYIKWPESMQLISKYSEILQLNVLKIAPVHCLFPGLRPDAFSDLFAIVAINAALIVFAAIVYGARKVMILRDGRLECDRKSRKISQFKETVYRNLFFFLYVTYLSTCSKTATVLPLSCLELCQDEEEEFCVEYLKADYSVQCHNRLYNKMVIVAYISTSYIILLPTATFVALWRNQRVLLATGDSTRSEDNWSNPAMIKGLHFFYKNYKSRSWYWELVEMSRKVIITSGLSLVGQESRSYIGLSWVVAGIYGILFSWIRPIQDAIENRLMTASLAVTVFNLGVGAMSKIPAENLPTSTDQYVEKEILDILVIGANTLVIGLIACKIMTCRSTNDRASHLVGRK